MSTQSSSVSLNVPSPHNFYVDPVGQAVQRLFEQHWVAKDDRRLLSFQQEAGNFKLIHSFSSKSSAEPRSRSNCRQSDSTHLKELVRLFAEPL